MADYHNIFMMFCLLMHSIVERDSVTNEVKKYYGDNTDWIGMYLPLSRLLSTNRNQNDKNGIAVILGAGGTAKAAAYTVQQLGLHPVRYVL